MTCLNLKNVRRPDGGIFLELLDVLDAKVAHTDTTHFPLPVYLLQCQPKFSPCLGSSVGAVNEKQVHVVMLFTSRRIELAYALEAFCVALVDGPRGGEDLGGDEDVLARDAGLLQRKADFSFISVDLSCVDVTVARLESREAGLDAETRRGVVYTEAEEGDFDGVGHRVGAIDGDFGHWPDRFDVLRLLLNDLTKQSASDLDSKC
jgi:hypothetical protein